MRTTEIYTVGEVKLTYQKKPAERQFQVRNAKDVHSIAKEIFDCEQMDIREEFWIMCFDQSNKLIKVSQISSGGTVASVVDIKIIALIALKSLAQGVVLVHNHPSGNLQPSDADIKATNKAKAALDILDIHLLDHLIINSSDEFYSFHDNGLIS